MQFPELAGKNLLNEDLKIPSDLEGNWRVLMIAFQRWHQGLVNSWIPGLEQLNKDIEGFRYYELPILATGYRVMRFVIDGGMRAGIPNNNVRKRTITIYTNKTKFKSQLAIPSEETIYLYLLNSEGNILEHAKGEFTSDKLSSFRKIIHNIAR